MHRSEALKVAQAAKEELHRGMQALAKRKPPRAYLLSHLIRDDEEWRVRAKYGTTSFENNFRQRNCFTDVRVGSYRNDQVQEGGLSDNSREDESYDHVRLPYGGATDGLRHGLWKLTDSRYREAVDRYLTKKSHELTYLNKNAHLPSFQKCDANEDIAWRRQPEVDLAAWRSFVERASKLLREYTEIKDGYVEFHGYHTTKVFVSSEGSVGVQCLPYFKLEFYLWLLSKKGDAVPWTKTYMVTDPSELPNLRQIKKDMRMKIERMREVAAAPPLRSFAGPVLLDPTPSGLLLHEALGHRLEGDRLLSTGEGQTFRDALGRDVLPEGLTMRDDPSLTHFNGQSLVGHYRFDDQGVPSTNASLITEGKLEGFLTSRSCVGKKHLSNGHARARFHERPISRMGVTIVESQNGLDDKGMKQALVDEVRRQKVPFGIRIIEANSGETTTEAYDFQAFLGEVSYATRVFPDGREEVIRGVDFVGTPLNAVRSIIATGNRQEVDNSYCGAESGFVPVSTIAPSLLLSHLELQAKSETPYTQYVYPIPFG